MIDRLEIHGFRGIAAGALDGLFPLTLLMGKNNSGKSTCLEALWLLLCPGFYEAARTIGGRRGTVGPELPVHLAPLGSGELVATGKGLIGGVVSGSSPRKNADDAEQAASEAAVRVSLALSRESNEHRVDIVRRFESPPGTPVAVEQRAAEEQQAHLIGSGGGGGPSGPPRAITFLPSRFVDTLLGSKDESESLSLVQAAGKSAYQRMLTQLRAVDPALRDISPRKVGGTWIVHMVYDDRDLPFAVAGDGIKRLFHLACILGSLGRGVLLLEDPECYQHPGALGALAHMLWIAVEAGTQIILSTHSLELFDYIAVSARESEGRAKQFGVYRMALREGKLVTARLPGLRAIELREDLAEDLRT